MARYRDDDLDVVFERIDNNRKRESSADYEDYTVDVEEVYESEKKNRRDNHKKKKKKRRRKITLLIAEIIVIAILSFTLVMLIMPNSKQWFLGTAVGKFFVGLFIDEDDYSNVFDDRFDEQNIGVNSDLDTSAMDGYMNIALFGLDSRDDELETGVNSDSIIIMSINEKTGDVKLVSVYRDTFLRVNNTDGSYSYNKINSAYCSGGAQETVKTLNQNLDLNISAYVSINFAGLADIIDALGGIEINISQKEMYEINNYLTETREVTGKYAPDVTSYGNVKLTGLQAVAFCRIRKVQFTDEDGTVYAEDYGRTARQRRVIMKIVELAKNAGVSKVLDVANEIFYGEEKVIYTSIPYDDIIDMIPTLMGFSISDSTGYPFSYDGTRDKVYLSDGTFIDWPIAIQGLSYNNYKLHEFLFGNTKYKPSETVKTINDNLIMLTQIEEKRLDGDEDIDLD